MNCSHNGCGRETLYKGLCSLHYWRKHAGVERPNLLRSDNLKRANLDNVAVGWLKAVLEKLPK